MTSLEWLEASSYVVTVVGFPFAIWVFMREQRKERQNDDEEVYLKLADDYEEFLKLTLEHADLRLITAPQVSVALTPEQRERRTVLFEILTALFERAYILAFEPDMNRDAARRWQTWEDYMRSWCRRGDYRAQLPSLLEGEDEDFRGYIRHLAEEEAPSEAALRIADPAPPVSVSAGGAS